jgi:isopenicillin N synthase-like dioxygenase
VLEYMSALESVGQQVLSLMAEGLHLDGDYFERQFTADPTVLFRIFRYPPDAASREGWGVGAHTDYGLLTLLQQDTVGGLQVLNRDRWLDVPRSQTRWSAMSATCWSDSPTAAISRRCIVRRT